MQKTIIISICCLAIAQPAIASTNPFTGSHRNQIALNLGQGVNSFALIPAPDMPVPYNMIQLTYSQPTDFFRIMARRNLSAVQNIGYGSKYTYTTQAQGTFEWNWTDYSVQIAMITWDVAIIYTKHFYFGAGAGFAIQGKQNEREGTKFLLPFKLFLGYHFADRWNAEIFTQHFSNGDTGGAANYSYNFYGLGIAYNF